ncbi:LPS export ABC transporter periplasmic protein LptC [Candidatus Pelagibacter sp.]|jgi:lipopolysaccharide export system protein LptA|nr:LPS export ABC transporter periplasmic protein LptC [Candidatus Pelagibacter sp.]|tara:strand:+ start:1616 stop:2203 length:588 start_codon:yes stop_codon:yes gene_type:complete
MQKKTILQLFLLIVVLIISIIFFKTYFGNKSNDNSLININENKKKTSDQKKSNIIHNLKYVSSDKNGNNYIITSKNGELNEDKPEIILMTNVVATINMKNSKPITISSDTAIFNNVNYDTNFSKNVFVTYEEHIITSDNLDLIFEKNLATISKNIIYKNLNTVLEADKVEIDLITKNSKIFMNDKSKKVKIFNIN